MLKRWILCFFAQRRYGENEYTESCQHISLQYFPTGLIQPCCQASSLWRNNSGQLRHELRMGRGKISCLPYDVTRPSCTDYLPSTPAWKRLSADNHQWTQSFAKKRTHPLQPPPEKPGNTDNDFFDPPVRRIIATAKLLPEKHTENLVRNSDFRVLFLRPVIDQSLRVVCSHARLTLACASRSFDLLPQFRWISLSSHPTPPTYPLHFGSCPSLTANAEPRSALPRCLNQKKTKNPD